MGIEGMTKIDKLGLTVKQRKAAELLANPQEQQTITDLCKAIHISRQTFYTWLDREEFRAYAERLIDRNSDSALGGVWKALIGKCLKGDTQAIKLYFELKGKYKKSQDMEDMGPIRSEVFGDD